MTSSLISSVGLSSIPFTEILRIGLSGFCFLLFLLSFILLYSEQKKDNIREEMLKSIHTYQKFAIGSTIILILPSLIPLIYKPSQPPFKPDFLIENLQMYPDVANTIKDLIHSKPYIYSKRNMEIIFQKSTNDKLLLTAIQTTEVFNPSDTTYVEPYRIRTTDEEFQSLNVLEYDATKTDNKGRLDWNLNREAYLRLPVELQGSGRTVVLGKLKIPPKGHKIIVLTIKVEKPFVCEQVFITSHILSGDLNLKIDSSSLGQGFEPGVLHFGSPGSELETKCIGPGIIVYIMKGIKLPGHGFVLNWRYSPTT